MSSTKKGPAKRGYTGDKMTALIILFHILNALLMIHALYFMLFGLWGLFRKIRIYDETNARKHFAVIIPARNEELVIGNLVKSIRMADYPSDLIDTYVVINNTTDNTSAAAEAEGAKVIDCDVPVKTKAEVLRFVFGKLRDHSEIDTYVIFDADNVVDPGFFTEINKAHAAGFKSAQAKRTGKNLRPTWVSGCYEIYYTMQNAYFNHPRNSAELTASINGTGWTIDKSVIDENGFDMTTITEDQEFTIWCAMNGIKIAYCSTALVYDEFTSNMRVSMKQRVRWSFGMLQNLRKYIGPLVRPALRGSWQCFDMAMVTLLPVVVLVSLLTAVLAYAFVDIPVSIPVFIVGLIAASWIGASTGALISVVKSGCSVKANIKGIILFPIFIVTWAPILLSCFFRRRLDWAPMKHDQVVSIEDKKKK